MMVIVLALQPLAVAVELVDLQEVVLVVIAVVRAIVVIVPTSK